MDAQDVNNGEQYDQSVLMPCNGSRRTTNKNREIVLLQNMRQRYTFDISDPMKDQIRNPIYPKEQSVQIIFEDPD